MTAALTPAEEKFFETQGAEAPPEMTPEAKPEPRPEVKTEAKPEPKPEAKAEEKPDDTPVNRSAYRREQEQRRAAEREAREQREARARLEGEIAALRGTQKPVEKPAIPEFEMDPATHLKMKVQTVDERLAELAKEANERKQREAFTNHRQQFLSVYRNAADEFSGKTKDFTQAYQHLLKAKDSELDAGGIDDPQERRQTLEQWEAWIVEQAMRRGHNPAERLYEMAKRTGYKQAEETPKAETVRDEETGRFKAVEEKLDTIAEGIAKSKSLGSASGTSGETKITLEALARMSEKDFAKISEDKWRELMGA